jgi:hypothetical protein
MAAMRALQKAVNSKNDNLSAYKHDFERTKKQLEQYVKEVKNITQRSKPTSPAPPKINVTSNSINTSSSRIKSLSQR